MKHIDYNEFRDVCDKLGEQRKWRKRLPKRVARILLKHCSHRERDGHALVCGLEDSTVVSCGVNTIDSCPFYRFILQLEEDE